MNSGKESPSLCSSLLFFFSKHCHSKNVLLVVLRVNALVIHHFLDLHIHEPLVLAGNHLFSCWSLHFIHQGAGGMRARTPGGEYMAGTSAVVRVCISRTAVDLISEVKS